MTQENDKSKTQSSKKIIFAGQNSRSNSERCKIIFKYLDFKCDYQVYSDSEQSIGKWQKQIRPHVFDVDHARPFFPYLIIDSVHKKKQQRELICTYEGIITYAIVNLNKQQLLGKNMRQQVSLEAAMVYFRRIQQQFQSKIEKGNEGQVTKQQCMEVIRDNLKRLSVHLAQKQFFCQSVTWCDFVIAEFLDGLFSLERQLKTQFKNLEEHRKRIWGLNGIKQYVQSEEFRSLSFRPDSRKKWQ